MSSDNWKNYERIIEAYKSESWAELCWLIHENDVTVVEKAGEYLGIDLFKWDDDYHKKKGPGGPEWTPPRLLPPHIDADTLEKSPSRRVKKFLESGKYPTKYIKSVKDFFGKKIKKAKTTADKTALREKKRQILKEIRQREKREEQSKKIKHLTTKKKNFTERTPAFKKCSLQIKN